MPEQISKYPEVTLSILKGVGARCGEGAKQQILTKCPAEQFCALPTGEICVYGIEQIPKMTQITTRELARVVCPPEQRFSLDSAAFLGTDGVIPGAAFVVGLLVGGVWQRFKKKG
jgi:hypothetical protein